MRSTTRTAHLVFLGFAFLSFLAPVAHAQPDAALRPPARSRLPGPDQAGPWDNDVLVYRVGAALKSEKIATFERSGVPTMARLKDGRLAAATQHFPKDDAAGFDKVAVRFSSDDGNTWTSPQVITMAGLPEDMRFPFDPTLVPLPDGRTRLYFTSRHQGRKAEGDKPALPDGDAAPPRAREVQDQPAIYSGISEDCIHFTFEPGTRFAIAGRPVIDCAAAILNGTFHLYAPDNGTQLDQPQPARRNRPRPEQPSPDRPRDEQPRQDQPRADGPRPGTGYHAISTDGLTFKRVEDVTIPSRGRWLGNATVITGKAEESARLIFIGTGGGPNPQQRPRPDQPAAQPTDQPPQDNPGTRRPAPRVGLWLAESSDGATFKLLDALPVPGADPGAVKLADGSWLVVVTGPPREGTPTAQQRRDRRPNAPDRNPE